MPPKRSASEMTGNSGKNKDSASKKIKALIKENQSTIRHNEREIYSFSMVLQDNNEDIRIFEERIRKLRQENVDYEEKIREFEEYNTDCKEKAAKLENIQKQMEDFELELNNKLRTEVEEAGLLSDLEELEEDGGNESDCKPVWL
ncbi:hypothetical protein BOTNAR_0647g00080 [Botryotinia narcissicola]|uniref:Uncharacterized protein n=1 Tax=Botryotinia narcissicola TaxID=278944 RepID=A0A4Z1HBQ1_9HELO|nr:hypothetical protein BOTNAR_0647g00080 [Botryotinia narcissicola]